MPKPYTVSLYIVCRLKKADVAKQAVSMVGPNIHKLFFAAINQPASVYSFQQMCQTSPGRPVVELGLTALLDLLVPERQQSSCLVFCIMQWVLNFVSEFYQQCYRIESIRTNHIKLYKIAVTVLRQNKL